MKNTIINKKDQTKHAKKLRKVSKAALKSGSSRDIAYYINRLFNYSQKFNVDFFYFRLSKTFGKIIFYE